MKTEKEFYKTIGSLDVVLSVEGKYPYKTIFRLRYGDVVGFEDEKGIYFIRE